MSCLVELRDVWVRIGKEQVLRRINLCVRRGDYLVVLGPSGSGKTTLLRVIAGLVEPERGRIIIDERDATHAPPWERGVALVQQIPGLLPHLSVLENVALAIETRRQVPRRRALSEAARLLELLRISDVASKRPGELSGGQLQRAAIAVALAIKPIVLLLDEPLSHLDRPLAEQLRLELRRIHKELGVTIIHVTHDQDEALSLATRLAILWSGELVEEGAPGKLYYRPRSVVTARFLGLNVVAGALFGKPGTVAIFPPDAAEIARSKGLRARIEEIVRERGRVIVYARLAETNEVVRIYVHPRETDALKSSEILLSIDEKSLHFLEGYQANPRYRY